jgi:Uma2 family endonuclease
MATKATTSIRAATVVKEQPRFVNREIPPLEAGDRLQRDEYLRRYRAMPDFDHAELIEGVVYMGSPVSAEGHGGPHFRMVTWLGTYQVNTPGVDGGDNATIELDDENLPQPDGYLRLLEDRGGKSMLVKGYLVGPPELIVEVSASTASYDLHDKLNAYRRNGVREYLVWRVWDREFDWFQLRGRRYQRLSPDRQGVYRSEVFPGLWLDSKAALAGNFKQVMATLQLGLASPEHQAFTSEG